MERSSEIHNESLHTLVCGLLSELESAGYSETTLRNYFRRLRPIQTYMAQIGENVYSDEIGNRYLNDYVSMHNPGKGLQRTIRACVERLNDYCKARGYVPQHHAENCRHIPEGFQPSVQSYLHLCAGSGNSPRTLDSKHRALSRFLSRCERSGCCSLEDLAPAVVLKACMPVSDRDEWAKVRAYLKYVSAEGFTRTDLSTLVPHHAREVRLPTTYTEAEVQAVEKSIDRTTSLGKRNLAIVLLAGRLGVRAGDIALLRMENLDFHSESISFVQQKTGNAIRLPMVPDVRAALADHIGNAGISEGPLFRRSFAPYGPISTSAIYYLVSKHLKLAGIDTAYKKHGPHALRSSLASSMINGDVPYDAVRDILGHTGTNAVRHYAKVDIEKLRRCAVCVPEPGGRFRSFLEGGLQDARV